MIEKNLKILNEEGMHARPAGVFVKVASGFKSSIQMRCGERAVNGKSIMSIMSLGLGYGSEITLVVTGEDESQAMDTLTQVVNTKFQPTAGALSA